MPVGLISSPVLVGANGDPLRSKVQLLLHFDGTNGSTTFTDKSPSARSPSSSTGGPQISTAQSVFGGASGLFQSANSDSLTYAAGSQWNFGTGDWSVEFRMRPVSVTGFKGVLGVGNGVNTGTWLIAQNGAALEFYHENGTQRIIGPSLSVNTWYGAALDCVNGAVKLRVDGTQSGSTYTASTAVGTSSDVLLLANNLGFSRYYDGYLEELRITKGAARNTANYTLAAQAFPDF